MDICSAMIREQLFLFPEHNHFIQKIKNIDYVDLSEIKNSQLTDKKFSDLAKGRYIIWREGGINPYMKELGPVFPYIQDTFKKTIKTIRVATGAQYPRIHINYYRDNVLLFYKPYIHSIIAEAFIENPLPKKLILVHHKNNNPLDYRLENLQHVSRSFNSQGVAKPKHGTGHDDYLANHYIRSTKK